MNLKEHNDIVQKLLAQITSKQSQIKQLNTKINKISKQSSNVTNIPKLDQFQAQKNINKKIQQLTKQHKDKVGQLTQQLRSKSTQNKQLKERLSTKNNLEAKQKQRIVQVMKKTIHNGVHNKYDHKIAALVSHYEQEIQRKDKFIQTLKRQVKSLSLTQGSLNTSQKKIQLETKQNFQSQNSFKQQNDSSKLLIHREEIAKLSKQVQKLKKMYETRDIQYKNMSKKYAELTKQYYRVLNQYGVEQPNAFSKTKPNMKNMKNHQKLSDQNATSSYRSSRMTDQIQNNQKVSSKFDLKTKKKHQIFEKRFEQQILQSQSNMSLTFEQNFKKFNNRPKIGQQKQLNFSNLQQENEDELQYDSKGQSRTKNDCNRIFDSQNYQDKEVQNQNQNLIQQVKQILNLQSNSDIIPFLHNISIKNKQIQLYHAITRCLHSFFYNFGMGKVSKTDLIQTLQLFELKVNKYVSNSQLLDELCIQVGSKRDHLKDKILQLKQIHNEYLTNIRNVAYIRQLHKSNKVMEFIQFFELDTSDLILPEQLKNIYQQLKFVDKFLKQANTLLQFQGKGIEDGLQNILKKLQNYQYYKQIAEKKLKKKQASKI